MTFLGPIGPLELGLSVCWSVVFIENLLQGPKDYLIMGNGELGIGNGECGEWGMGTSG